MKNQYFGDKRDLFKFDLLLDLMASGRFKQLTYVPMLTKGDATKEGQLTRRNPVGHRSELFEFLKEKRSSGNLNIRNWKDYFAGKQQLDYCAYRDNRDDYSHGDRKAYFGGVDEAMLQGACVFVDPDIGVERRTFSYMNNAKRGAEKYLFIDDLSGLLERSHDSLIIVYQHLQKDAALRLGNIAADIDHLSKRLGLSAVPFMRENDLVFYAVSRDEGLQRLAASTFFAHAEKTEQLKSHVTDILRVAKLTLGPEIGIADLAVFGSIARGDQGDESDIDVMVRFDKPATLRGYFGVHRHLEKALGRDVDLVTDKALRPEMRPGVEREALRAA